MDETGNAVVKYSAVITICMSDYIAIIDKLICSQEGNQAQANCHKKFCVKRNIMSVSSVHRETQFAGERFVI